jgi:hypothetical protein
LWGPFCEEGEGDFSPLSVSPVSAHNEGNYSIIVWADCLDGEEKVGTVVTLEVIDSCITNEVPMATPGAQLKGASKV